MNNSAFVNPVILILLSAFNFGCNITESNKPDLPNIDIKSSINNMKIISLSKFTDKIIYVPLETNEESMVRDYLDIDISDDYIVTTNSESSIILFDRSGNFVSKFGTKGRGPNEYQSIENLTINKSSVIFNSGSDIYEYHTDGTFIGIDKGSLLIEKKYLLQNWILVSDSLIFGHIANNTGQTPYKGMLIDRDGKVLKSFKNNDLIENKGTRVNGGATQVYEFNNTVYFKEQFTDTLFFLDKNSHLLPGYSFSLGNLKMPESTRANFFKYFQKVDDYVSIEDIFETSDYLFLDVNFGSRFPAVRLTPKNSVREDEKMITTNTTHCLGVYDKESAELVFSKPTSTDNSLYTSGIYNDIDAGPRFFPSKMVNDSTMLMVISARDIKNHIKTNEFRNGLVKSQEMKSKIENLVSGLKETDNPIVVIVSLNNKDS